MHSVEWNDVINIAVGWALTFVLGFEREVRARQPATAPSQ